MTAGAVRIARELRAWRAGTPMLIGRDGELDALAAHLRNGRSVFLSGPAGIGKTALLRTVYAQSGASTGGRTILYCGASGSRRVLAQRLLVSAFVAFARLDSRYIGRRTRIVSPAELEHFLRGATQAELTRMMHQTIAQGPCALLLDHVDHCHARVAAPVELWLERLPLVIVARSADATGRVRWLLSSCERLELGPLAPPASLRLARALAAESAAPIGESAIAAAAVRAAGNPGRLSELMRAAAHPRYQRNGAIRWPLIELDLRIRDAAAGLRRRTDAGGQ